MADIQRRVADRMLDFDEASASNTYRACAQGILKDIRTATEVHGGYQELISEQGLKVSHLGL